MSDPLAEPLFSQQRSGGFDRLGQLEDRPGQGGIEPAERCGEGAMAAAEIQQAPRLWRRGQLAGGLLGPGLGRGPHRGLVAGPGLRLQTAVEIHPLAAHDIGIDALHQPPLIEIVEHHVADVVRRALQEPPPRASRQSVGFSPRGQIARSHQGVQQALCAGQGHAAGARHRVGRSRAGCQRLEHPALYAHHHGAGVQAGEHGVEDRGRDRVGRHPQPFQRSLRYHPDAHRQSSEPINDRLSVIGTERSVKGEPPLPSPPRQSRRDEILEIAARLFAERGFDAVSTRVIAQAAGVSQPTLYSHFHSKHALLQEIVAPWLRLLQQRLAEAWTTPADRRVRLEALCRAYVELAHEQPQAYYIAFVLPNDLGESDRAALGEPFLTAGRQAFDEARMAVRLFIADGAAAEIAAQSLWAALHGLVTLTIWRPQFRWANQGELLSRHVGMICDSIEHEAAQGQGQASLDTA